MPYTVKQISDVHLKVILHRLSTVGDRPLVAIGTPSTDGQMHSYIYDNIFDLGNKYDETTQVYRVANNAWDVDEFQGKEIEIIEYPQGAFTVKPPINLDDIKQEASANSNGDVSLSSSSANNTTGTAKQTASSAGTQRPGVAYAFANHLYDGFMFATLAGAAAQPTAQDYFDLSDMLYDNQRVALVGQTTDLKDIYNAYQHVQGYQTDDAKLGNFAMVWEPNSKKFPVGSMLGYAASNWPVDFKHIGNLDDFDVPDGLTQDTIDVLDQINGMTIEQTANDYMVSSGKALAGNYLDQFVNTQYAVDAYQFTLQNFLNHKKFGYTQGEIDLMEVALKETDGQLLAKRVLYQPSDITAQKRADVSNTDVSEREYNGFKIKAQINDDIETINGIIDMTV
ncbi:hypothetical protein [Nicoliella lavandulae]|uniref:Uncharacterized protein n=1 Tax=Nicoliella lavandulae TaxID=3082954 RepID=A0ABU8SMA5_9LACO